MHLSLQQAYYESELAKISMDADVVETRDQVLNSTNELLLIANYSFPR